MSSALRPAQRRRGHLRPALGIVTTALAVLAATAPAALADNIVNTLDTSVDAVAEVMSLNVGGSDGTTTLYVDTANGDGKQGCNLTGSTTLQVDVSSSDTSVATVSPSSITFGSCGDTPTLTVTPKNEGSTTISLSQTSNNTGATFDLGPAKFTVNVSAPAPANTAPQLSISGVTAGHDYAKGSVPTATCVVTDAEDGNSSFAATLSDVTGPYASDGIGSQTASCSYTDAGGLPASGSVTYNIVDPSAPVIGYDLSPAAPDGAHDWYKSDVTLTWHVSDTDSPNSLGTSGCVDQSITADQAATTYSCSATSAGGSTGPVTVSIKRDSHGPEVSYTSASGTQGNDGWYTTDVTATFTATDALSGPASQTGTATSSGEGAAVQVSSPAFSDDAGNTTAAGAASHSFKIDKTGPTITDGGFSSGTAGNNGWYTSAVAESFTASDATSGLADCQAAFTENSGANEGESVTVASGPCSDVAGNTSPSIDSTDSYKIDLSDPTDIAFVGGPADGSSSYFGSVPAAPTCTASDAVSGLHDCTVTGYDTSVGTHTLTATATDNAGRTATSTRQYTVLAWTLSGFYAPVDMNGVYNTVKGGSTVPLKFELFAGSTELTDIGDIASFTTQRITCSGTAVTDAVEVTSTGGTSLRYDATAGQFIQNWKTPTGQAGACYKATMTAQDGNSISAFFKLK